MHLALDHLTVTRAYPWEIVALAGQNGLQGCCLFLESMSVLPSMPRYSLIEDGDALDRTVRALDEHGVTLDLVYPFTISSRSQVTDFTDTLRTASALKAQAVNLLVYDRDFQRSVETVRAMSDAAAEAAMDALIEFYPASAVKTLDQAHELVEAAARPNLGINVDVLHLYRSGGGIEDLTRYGRHIRFAQLADGPLSAPEDLVFEAAQARTDPGQGQFDLAGFVERLPSVPVSFEIPTSNAIDAQARVATLSRHIRGNLVNR